MLKLEKPSLSFFDLCFSHNALSLPAPLNELQKEGEKGEEEQPHEEGDRNDYALGGLGPRRQCGSGNKLHYVMEPMFELCEIRRDLISDDENHIFSYILCLEKFLFDLSQMVKGTIRNFFFQSLFQSGQEFQF